MADDPLLDTMPLRDQRTMVDVRHPDEAHTTPAEVEAAWHEWATREGLPIRRRSGDYTTDLRESPKTIVCHISAGKWIGDCPNCNGGVPGWPYHSRGCCLDCGTIYSMEYPAAADIETIVGLFSNRAELDRNFFPHKGETVAALETEQASVELAAPASGALDLATLKATLSPDAYAELEKAGLA